MIQGESDAVEWVDTSNRFNVFDKLDETIPTEIPVGYVLPFVGDDIPDGWIVADGRMVSNKTPAARLLYFLLWHNSEEMGNDFSKGRTSQEDWEAGVELKIPDLRNNAAGLYEKERVLIKL